MTMTLDEAWVREQVGAATTWLDDRRAAFAAAKRSATSQWRQALRNRARDREREAPEAKARKAVRAAEYSEDERRNDVLRVDSQYRDRAWAENLGNVAAMAVGAALAVIVGGWASFWFIATDSGDVRSSALVGTLWLVLPVVIGMMLFAWGIRTGRVAREADSVRRNRESMMRRYDEAWAKLAEAERAAGLPGVAYVVAPTLWDPVTAADNTYRPSTALLALEQPWAVEAEARKLAEARGEGNADE